VTLSDCVVYSVFSAGILLLLVCLAVIEREKLAGLPSGVWLALRALIWAALLAAWFGAFAAWFAHVVARGALEGVGVFGSEAPRTGLVLYSAGGAVVSLCVALAMTALGVYLYRNLWQLAAVLPRLTRRAER
jgi:ABC-type dipeptide/oligopeptide/nickel transport system permease component